MDYVFPRWLTWSDARDENVSTQNKEAKFSSDDGGDSGSADICNLSYTKIKLKKSYVNYIGFFICINSF